MPTIRTVAAAAVVAAAAHRTPEWDVAAVNNIVVSAAILAVAHYIRRN